MEEFSSAHSILRMELPLTGSFLGQNSYKKMVKWNFFFLRPPCTNEIGIKIEEENLNYKCNARWGRRKIVAKKEEDDDEKRIGAKIAHVATFVPFLSAF